MKIIGGKYNPHDEIPTHCPKCKTRLTEDKEEKATHDYPGSKARLYCEACEWDAEKDL
jgi:hypothetical protein